MNEGKDRPRLDEVAHSILWRIRDASRYLATIVPMITSSPDSFEDGAKERFHRRLHESQTPQRMNRLLVAHSAAEDGFKYLIKRRGGYYPKGQKGHNLRVLLDQLRACDPSTAEWLDDAFDAVTTFYGTDISDPDHGHLASLSAYLEKVGDPKHFQLMRYLELESSVYDPALRYIHMEFHHEILCALDEAIQPIYGTIGNRVESLARRDFLRSDRLSSLASHGEESQAAYTRWLEEQSSFVEAMRKLTACRSAIGDQHADKVARSVCNELTGHEDLALQAIANGLVRSEPTQQGEMETRAHRPVEKGNWLVATPAGDVLGYMRQLPSGFWVATDDPSRGSPSWFRTERDARLWLAHMFIGELSIITERGRFSYQARSKQRHPTPHDQEWMWLHDFNWAELNTGEILLRFWDARHGLRPGEYVSIDVDVGAFRGEQFWCGHVTEVVGHVVYLGETELRPSTESRGGQGMPKVEGSKQ